MIDPISQTILKKIETAVQKQPRNIFAYRRQCPKCRKWIVKETLLEQGCFVCGWKAKTRERNGI